MLVGEEGKRSPSAISRLHRHRRDISRAFGADATPRTPSRPENSSNEHGYIRGSLVLTEGACGYSNCNELWQRAFRPSRVPRPCPPACSVFFAIGAKRQPAINGRDFYQCPKTKVETNIDGGDGRRATGVLDGVKGERGCS